MKIFRRVPLIFVLRGEAESTVLGQKKHTHRMLYNFASSRPITLVFTHRTRYISPNFRKKKLGRTPKINLHFLDFSKKSATRKTRFFPVGRNFGHRFLKNGPKSLIFGVPELENFFRQTFDKKTPTQNKFRSGPSTSTF